MKRLTTDAPRGDFEIMLNYLRSRLKMYEDTMPLERVQELAQAEKVGRLVALPCKVGDTVYVTYGERYRLFVITYIHVLANCDVRIHMTHGCTETLGLSASEFGKTVFLTCEEAEAALKKRGEADDETDLDCGNV